MKKYEFRRFRRFGGFHRFRRFCGLVIHSSVTTKNMKNSSQTFRAQPLKIQIGQKFYLTRQIWNPTNLLEEISSFPNFCVSVCLPLHRAKTKHFFFLDSAFFFQRHLLRPTVSSGMFPTCSKFPAADYWIAGMLNFLLIYPSAPWGKQEKSQVDVKVHVVYRMH